MTTLKLLPRGYRIFGLIIILPVVGLFFYDPEIAFGNMTIFKEPSGTFVFNVPSFFDENGESIIHWIKNDITNEILLTLMLMGTYFIAFSRVKDEDEFSERLRLESMTSAIVWNSVLLLLMNWLFYGGGFLYIMITQLFSFLLIFSLIFALKIRKLRKGLGHEE